MVIQKTFAICGAFAACLLTAASNAEFQILSSELTLDGTEGAGYYNGPLTDAAMWGSDGYAGYYDWSGTGGQYVSFEGGGGDYYGVQDSGDNSGSDYWEEFFGSYVEMTMTFSITESIQLIGWGNLGFSLVDENGVSADGALSGTAAGMVLSAGVYTLSVGDYGYGDATGDSNNYYYEDEFGYFSYDYSWWTQYDYSGGFEFAAVPAPGIISLFAIAGIRRRRRK
ncbi:MAG TPA: hypothetical protein EYO40_05615 [Phycisphaerales bacterium]|nr:hypothetical protein [Phycisphaerales bacterium]HIB50736.1 hypothetical protein [Phycisphaerales bacterium]